MTLLPQLPPATQPLFESDGRPMSRHWYRFFQQFWESIGWFPGRPVYDTIYVPINRSATASGSSSAAWTAQLPNTYRLGTEVGISLLWHPTTADTGNVVFDLAYSVGSIGDSLTSSTTGSLTVAAGGVTDIVKEAAFTAIPSTNLARGDVLKGTIARDGADAADTYGAIAYMLGLVLTYRVQGSGAET